MTTPNPEMARTMSPPALKAAIHDVLSRRPGDLHDIRSELDGLTEFELRTAAEVIFEADILFRRP